MASSFVTSQNNPPHLRNFDPDDNSDEYEVDDFDGDYMDERYIIFQYTRYFCLIYTQV